MFHYTYIPCTESGNMKFSVRFLAIRDVVCATPNTLACQDDVVACVLAKHPEYDSATVHEEVEFLLDNGYFVFDNGSAHDLQLDTWAKVYTRFEGVRHMATSYMPPPRLTGGGAEPSSRAGVPGAGFSHP